MRRPRPELGRYATDKKKIKSGLWMHYFQARYVNETRPLRKNFKERFSKRA